jgi:hypothetical protein
MNFVFPGNTDNVTMASSRKRLLYGVQNFPLVKIITLLA